MKVLKGHKFPEKMQAVILEKPETLTVKEIPVWPIESYGDPDLVMVRVEACGICGSDLRYFKGENPWAQHTLGRHVENPPNIVPGHEFAGTVVAVLDEKNARRLGKRVAPVCSKVCGVCRYCRTEREHLCPNTVHTGHGQGWGEQEYYPGAYAVYVPVWAKGCYEIPESLSFVEASMMDILAVCTRVANQGNIRQGEPVLIIGAGPAGNGIGQIAEMLGASKVVMIGRSDITLDIAAKCGFPDVIDTKAVDDVEKAISAQLGPGGAMTVFDSVGSEWSIKMGLRILDKTGTLVNMAVHDSEIKLNQMELGGERGIVTACNFRAHEYPTTLNWLIEGKINVKPWISTVRRAEVPETFLKLLDKEKGRQFFKVVITD